ncbi:hypothetical protein QBC46DRAFT_321718 [Diplogelasinospora grovesii]|uniref:Oxidoreductase-like protein n=1 Tax=Diplogelasinospora grovesii TaxID=303347 RepID=A0AAN6N063_9PEZI|nr:hypothetical protein QBC46DRAFT_321718 [Diplogelasinospora grovesii]
MTTRPHIEARSLSAINSLAANPPQYPHRPEPLESLTLYISRVPGTRDVMLSTFKPQRKNVTAEDVANSLYYVHLHLPSDEQLAAPPRLERAAEPRTSGESARSAIPRKPLPASARVPKLDSVASDTVTPVASGKAPNFETSVSDSAAPAVTASPTEASADGYRTNPMFRKRLSGAMSENPELPPRPQPQYHPPAGVPVVRKPLGPRPQGQGQGGAPTPEKDLPATPGSTPRERPSQQARLLSPASPMAAEPLQTHPPEPSRTPSPITRGRRPSFTPFSLTIIRRDPTSGNQWNIGKVSSFQTNIPTPDAADPDLNPENMGVPPRVQKIDIHLETSGYAKYRGMPSRASVEAYRPTSASSFAEAMRGFASRPTVSATDSAAVKVGAGGLGQIQEVFSRQVMTSYTKSWTSNLKQAFRRHERSHSGEGGVSPEELAPPRPHHVRHDSSGSMGSVDSVAWGEGRQGREERDSPPLITQPGPGLKPRGYVFMSPWDGVCEFRTSNSGRSLKCRHVPDPKSPSFMAMAQNIRDAHASGRSRSGSLSSALAGAKPVSELRFNLPSGDLFGPSKGNGGVKDLHGQFNKLLGLEARSSEDDEDEDTLMDLSLGRERAGGGKRGKRAKLGKLIIHDEGLKMLDLVMAANMGVWWITWERTF